MGFFLRIDDSIGVLPLLQTIPMSEQLLAMSKYVEFSNMPCEGSFYTYHWCTCTNTL